MEGKFMRYLSSSAFLSVLLSLSSAAPASEHPLGLNRNHSYGRLTTDYVTPHVAWANPYCRGKVKTLIMAPTWSQRETVELAQRLSLDFTAWMPSGFNKVVYPASSDPAGAWIQPPPNLVFKLLREYLDRDYDVIVVGKLDWQMLPAKQRFEILRRVSEGTGLVYVNPPESDKELDIVLRNRPVCEGALFIAGNLPLSSLPRLKGKSAEDMVRTMFFGKGRVVVLDYQEPPPDESRAKHASKCAGWPALTPQWDLSDSTKGYVPPDDCPEIELVPYEYYQALVARALLWASGKTPESRLNNIDLPETLDYPVSDRRARAEMTAVPTGAVLRAQVRSRHDYDQEYDIPTQSAQTTDIPLPDLPAGEYFLDVWLADADGRVLDWASRSLTVNADVDVSVVMLGGRSYNSGDKIVGEIKLSRRLTEGELLTVELQDNRGRILDCRQLNREDGRYPFALELANPLTIMHRIVARLSRHGRDVCVSRAEFPVRARLRRDDFNEAVWANAPNQFITHQMLRKLSGHDQADTLDLGWRGATNARNIAAANLSLLPYTARFGCFGSKDNIVKTKPGSAYGCMSSPVTLKAVDKWGATQSDICGPYGPFAWTHGDETNYSAHNPDICWSPTCLAAFREHLKTRYPDLASLNREWGASYTRWDDVMPLTFEDARDSEVYAPWVEHRLSACKVFAEFYARTGDALSKHDPGARAGFDAASPPRYPNNGSDWWLLSQHCDILHTYFGNSATIEVFRSFANPRQIRGIWYGTYNLTWQIGPNTVSYCHFFPWYSLFHQLNTTWFWSMGSPGPLSGYAPDLASLPFFEARTESLKTIRSGTGKLLLGGVRENDRIAIHFSNTSRIVDSFYALNKKDWSKGYNEALRDFDKALEDNGLQYDYVSYAQVAKGDLIEEGFQVFVMPHSRALSTEEAEQIRKFVEQGGVVIADIVPGMHNGHGTLLKQSLLADLFPVDKQGEISRAGKGRTVLTGDIISGYGKAHSNQNGWKQVGTGDRCRPLGELLRKHASVAPQVRIVPLDVDKMPPTEISRFRCGNIQFIGLLRENFLYDNAEYPVEITFPCRSHLYDVMTGEYLGKTSSVRSGISYRAKLYALSPYRVRNVGVDAEDNAESGTPTSIAVSVRAGGFFGLFSRGTPLSTHCLRLEVTAPDGRILPWYSQNVIAAGGRASTEIPWALNDAPGEYTVSIRDVMSGVTARKTIKLAQRR